MDRRKFLRTFGVASGAAILTRAGLFDNASAESNRRSRVVMARDESFADAQGRINAEAVSAKLGAAVTRATDGGWGVLFSPKDTVGIKVNCLAGKGLSPNWAVVAAVINGLKSAGVKEENIIVWDRTSHEMEAVGYPVNTARNGVKCFGTDALGTEGYEPQPKFSGAIGSCFSKILGSACNAIVNVAVLKDHDLAGVSVGLKNFYGAIHNPNKYHDNNCDPYVAHLFNHPYVKDKVRLTVCDAIWAGYNGGPGYKPQWTWRFNGLLVSTDTVALDSVGFSIIEEKRKAEGLPSLQESKRFPKYIFTAAQMGLGNADPQLIEKIEV